VPSRDWRLRLQDILQSITGIEQRTANITFEEFQNNETLVKAVLYDFVVIGEASRTGTQTDPRLLGEVGDLA